jgi:hypothetical protein
MSTSPRGSASPAPGTGPRHALNAVEKQRAQLDRLLKNPEKPAYVPPPPKEKSLRPAREMMKNVQGSSAGAGSGEFHVYKASRRREYERLKMMEEEAEKVCCFDYYGIVACSCSNMSRKPLQPSSRRREGRGTQRLMRRLPRTGQGDRSRRSVPKLENRMAKKGESQVEERRGMRLMCP